MSLHFFAIPALQPQAAQDEFNAFCVAHRVVQGGRQLVSAWRQSFLGPATGPQAPNRKTPGVLEAARAAALDRRLPGLPVLTST